MSAPKPPSPLSRRRLLTAAATMPLVLGCRRKKQLDQAPEQRLLTVAQEQQASWIPNFNPLLIPDSVRWPTPSGVYEPLLIFNAIKGEYVPWLATGFGFEAGNKRLSFQIRKGVQWSDGKPFTPQDVVFTFELLRDHPGLDLYQVWSYLERVGANGERVTFEFARVFVPALFRIGQQPIVPQHVWSAVVDPVKFSNERPVATGPFTEIRRFQGQVYELGRNPSYWQPQKPQIAGLRFPAYSSNEQAHLALISGEVDWSGRFVPDIESVFVERDPEHHRYWFPRMGGMVSLFANLTQSRFQDVRVRKALSMAIDRQRLVKLGMYDYTRPADATGLSDAFVSWRDPQAAAETWTQFDRAAAERLLDEAGYRAGEDGQRVNADGTPLSFSLSVVSGWSDWVRCAQLITSDWKEIGVSAQLEALDYSAWFDALLQGRFEVSIGSAKEGPTPYEFYAFLMSSKALKPVGQASPSNWQRFQHPACDTLLDQFERTADPARQRQLATELQRVFSEHAPVLPLFPSPSWGICSTRRFEGFPSAQDPFARLSPYVSPEYLLVLLNLRPRTG